MAGRGAGPQEWRHGWIPLTPAAALVKAKGSKTGAAKLRKQHGVKSSSTRDLVRSARQTSIGSSSSSSSSSKPRQADIPTPDTTVAAKQRRAAIERMSNADLADKLKSTNNGQTRRFIQEEQGRRASIARGERPAVRRTGDDPESQERARIGQLSVAMRNNRTGNSDVPSLGPDQLQQIADSPYTDASAKAQARKDLDYWGYRSARARLANRTPEQLAEIRGKLDNSGLPDYEIRGAKKFIADQIGDGTPVKLKTDAEVGNVFPSFRDASRRASVNTATAGRRPDAVVTGRGTDLGTAGAGSAKPTRPEDLKVGDRMQRGNSYKAITEIRQERGEVLVRLDGEDGFTRLMAGPNGNRPSVIPADQMEARRRAIADRATVTDGTGRTVPEPRLDPPRRPSMASQLRDPATRDQALVKAFQTTKQRRVEAAGAARADGNTIAVGALKVGTVKKLGGTWLAYDEAGRAFPQATPTKREAIGALVLSARQRGRIT